MTHNERVCHEAGERRQHYLNQIKCILERIDDTPCVKDAGGTVGQESYEKPLVEYPGYVNYLNPKFNKPFTKPLLPNVVAERRLYCDEEDRDIDGKPKEIHDMCKAILNSDERTPNPQPNHSIRSKPAELKMGYLVQGCDCRKHNGLQDRCQRTECGGKPPCLTQPDPSCGPSNVYMTPPKDKTRAELVEEALMKWSRPKLQYCCCSIKCGEVQTYGMNPQDGPVK
ncbi:unnamed protein product, partial [Nesidiocoris tenuis]